MAPNGIVSAISFPALEERFAADLGELLHCGAGAAWVLVPTNLLALHLRRFCADKFAGVAGVEFLVLKDAARRMIAHELAAEGRRPVPRGAQELVLQRLLEGVPEGSYFSDFRPFPNAARAVLRAIRVLQNALWRPENLRAAARRGEFADPAAPRRLTELAELWKELTSWKVERGLFAADDLILEAARSTSTPRERPEALFIYGFYDFTPAQRALVRRVTEAADACTAYLLWSEEDGEPLPGFKYAAPSVEWLQELLDGGAPEQVPPGPTPPPSSKLGRIVGGLFADYPSPTEEEAEQVMQRCEGDGSVRVLSCPGEEPEADEVAREALRAIQSTGGPIQIGILMRNAEPTMGLLGEAFERVGTEWYAAEGLPLSETVTGRVALGALEVATGSVERADVVSFCALARLDWPAELSAVALDRLSRQAGVVKGLEQWQRLREHGHALLEEAEHTEDEAEARSLRRDAQLCQVAAGFVGELFGQMDFQQDRSWRAASGRLRALLERYAPEEDPARGAVLEAVDALAPLDLAETPPEPGKLRWTLGTMLGRKSRRRGRFQGCAVTASGIMRSRGATFDVVISPGLVEKSFPSRIPEQPLLTDLDRRTLIGLAEELGCGELPLRRNRPAEERYLLSIAVGSARRRLVLTYPRLDRDKGRPRMPSRFLGEVCSALCGIALNAGALDEGCPAEWFRRVPLQRGDRSELDPRLALDGREYDAAAFASGGSYSTGYLAAVSPWFQRALQMEEGRWGRRRFGRFDGKVRAPELLEFLQQRAAPEEPVSPTRLERYARCPFAYFMSNVLEVEEIEEPAEEFALGHLERGLLVHKLLKRLYEARLKGQPLGKLTDEAIAALLGEAADLLGRLGGAHAERRPAVWQTEREQIIAELHGLLEHERAEHAEASPERFEYAFRRSPEVLEEGLTFRGRIDRIDRLAGGALRIVDYKTGTTRRRQNRFIGGTQLQLPVYLLCAAEELEAGKAEALYLHTAGPADVPQFNLKELRDRMEEFRTAVRLIRRGIAGGDFFPLPAADSRSRARCSRYCPFRRVCGAAREKLAEMKQGDPDAARLEELRAIE